MAKAAKHHLFVQFHGSSSHLDYIGLIRMNLPGKGRSIMRISKDVWSRPRIMIYLCLLPVYWLELPIII